MIRLLLDEGDVFWLRADCIISIISYGKSCCNIKFASYRGEMYELRNVQESADSVAARVNEATKLKLTDFEG